MSILTPKCRAETPDGEHLCLLPKGHKTEDHFCIGGDLTWPNPAFTNRPRLKKAEAIEAIIDSAPSELRLTPVQWKHIANLLGRAYEDGRAMAGDTDA